MACAANRISGAVARTNHEDLAQQLLVLLAGPLVCIADVYDAGIRNASPQGERKPDKRLVPLQWQRALRRRQQVLCSGTCSTGRHNIWRKKATKGAMRRTMC